MAGNPDYRDLFSALNVVKTRYLVVGAYAVIHYTVPRYTKDLDVWIEPTIENGRTVLTALAQFGAPLTGISLQELTNPDLIYQIGIEPNRIDILMGVDGLSFDAAFEHSVEVSYDGEPIRILSLNDLITAKRTSGRLQDLLDLEMLEKKKAGIGASSDEIDSL